MDMTTLGAALALMRKIVPSATSADVGKIMVVDSSGNWTAGEPVDATITVENHTLKITAQA